MIDAISEVYELKKGSGQETSTYFGVTMEALSTGDGEAWGMSPSAYLANEAKGIEVC